MGYYADGTAKPDVDTLKKISDFFDVSADFLLGRTDYTSAELRACTFEDYGFSQAAVEQINRMSTVKSLTELSIRSEADNYRRETIHDGASFDMLVRLLEDPRFVAFLHGAAVFADMHISEDARSEAAAQIGAYQHTYKTTGAVIRDVALQEAIRPLTELLREIEQERREKENG